MSLRAGRLLPCLLLLLGGLATQPPPVTATPLAPDVGASLAELHSSLSDGRDPRAVRAFRAVGTIEMGGQVVGTTRTVAARNPPALREVLEMAGVRQVAVLIGDEAWFEDPNGSVRSATGDELASYRLAHSLLFHTYLEGEVPGFDLQREPGALRFLPQQDGAARVLELADDEEGRLLPSLLRQRQQGAEITTTFEDWRTFDGVRMPFRSVQSSGDARFDLVLTTTGVEMPDALDPDEILPLLAGSHPADAALLDPERAASIPLRRFGALLMVQAEVNGHETTFLIDTGAGATVLSSRLADRLSLSRRGVVEARGAGGSEAGGYVDLARLSLPGVEIRDQTVVVLPLGPLRDATGHEVDGILGYDFLSRFALEIDYAHKTLGLFALGGYAPRDCSSRVDLRVEANVPRIQATVDGIHGGNFVLDLGNATSLVLHTSFAAEHGYLDRAGDASFSLSGIGGSEAMSRVTVGSLALGDVVFREVPAVIARSGEGVLALEESLGNVGGDLFDGAVVAFDYSEGALWVCPASADSASGR